MSRRMASRYRKKEKETGNLKKSRSGLARLSAPSRRRKEKKGKHNRKAPMLPVLHFKRPQLRGRREKKT